MPSYLSSEAINCKHTFPLNKLINLNALKKSMLNFKRVAISKISYHGSVAV